MTISLIKMTDEHMTRQKIHLPRQPHYYPSEASVTWIDSTGEKRCAGTCHRATYFRMSNVVPAARTTPYAQWIFALGKAVEEILVEQWKEMGIWVANNVEFYWDKYNIKGEIDCILVEPETNVMYLTEIKSIYGYNASKEVIGNAKQIGKPKTSQMLQTLVYLYRFQDQFPYAKMVYYARDSADRTEFDLTLVKEGENKTRVAINGIIDPRFYVENILNRYEVIDQYVQMKQIPPNDYEAEWSEEKVERRFALGEVGKTTYEKWKKGKDTIGDWQCSYCNFKELCWEQK